MVQAWIFNEQDHSDQREPHQTNPVEFVPLDVLDTIGVSYWHLNTEGAVENPLGGEIGEIRAKRGYKNHDIITISREKLPNYEEKLKIFYEEHLHEDEEIRFCLDGSGYFDVRNDLDGRWIRIAVVKGDMIVLPAGMYHRFTLDSNNYIQAMRLFKDMPKWEALNRGPNADGTSSRKEYLDFTATIPIVEAQRKQKIADEESVNGEAFIATANAKAIANYPHMRAFGGLLYVSGISSRRPDNTHVGATRQEDGTFVLDIKQQTAAVLDNIKSILSQAGASLEHVIDVTVFLVDMSHYAGMNEIYNTYFPTPSAGPTRTTVAVHQLPHPNILVEIKIVAADPRK